MCPITLPDRESEWKAAIDECAAYYGEGNFCSFDVQEWIDGKCQA
jgi:hypothetical protein